MKKIIIAAIAFTCLCTNSFAWDRNIHIEWGYTPPEDLKVSGYQLYQNGNKICVFKGASTFSGDCGVKLTKSKTQFALTAVFEDGQESPKSPDFVFTDFGEGPKMIILIGK